MLYYGLVAKSLRNNKRKV